jgi:hypothetical protein
MILCAYNTRSYVIDTIRISSRNFILGEEFTDCMALRPWQAGRVREGDVPAAAQSVKPKIL